jgi:folate-binding protein YgfZ
MSTVYELWQSLLPEAVMVGRSAPWAPPNALDHLGDPNGERVALLRNEALVLPRLAHGHLRLTGSDRVPFLHGLVSQDVAGLRDGEAVDALLLDHRGQPQAGLGVVRREHDLFVVAEEGSAERLLERLGAHIIFDDVTLARIDERLVSLTLFGEASALVDSLEAAFPGAGAAFAAVAREGGVRAPTAGTTTPHGRALLRPRRFGPLGAVDVHLLAEDLSAAWSAWRARGLRPIGERALTAARVAFAIASPFAEGRLGLPQETGLEERVSYRKGCYLGQEIMARIEARGRVRRGLQRLRLAAPPPGLGVAGGWLLYGEGADPIGGVVSAAPAPDGEGWWAIGVVRNDALTAGGASGWPWQLRVDGPPPRVGALEVPAGLRERVVG